MSDSNEILIGSKEAAEMLRISSATLYKWEKKGIIKPVYVSPTRRRFFSKSDIEALIARGRV